MVVVAGVVLELVVDWRERWRGWLVNRMISTAPVGEAGNRPWQVSISLMR